MENSSENAEKLQVRASERGRTGEFRPVTLARDDFLSEPEQAHAAWKNLKADPSPNGITQKSGKGLIHAARNTMY
jgi:hypothetical protein